MSDDIFERINILRAIAHETHLPTVPDGHLTLSHEVTGVLTTAQLREVMIRDGIQFENVNGFEFHEAFMKKVMELVMEGYRVQGDWIHAAIGLSGTVPPDRLGHNAHADEVRIRVNFNLGKRSREMVEHIQVAIHEHISSGAPVIQSIMNPTVGTPDTVNVGDMVVINGLNIAVEGDKTAEIGVFFTPVSGGADVHIPAGKFAPNTASHVQFVLPAAVSAGEWTVRLATQTSGRSKSQTTKDVRSSTYEVPVQVV
jgi:uncharacterized Zn-binding protein involved in type VI secretion